MMNCFCGITDRRKAFSFISNGDHCQRSSPLGISDTPRAELNPEQNLRGPCKKKFLSNFRSASQVSYVSFTQWLEILINWFFIKNVGKY